MAVQFTVDDKTYRTDDLTLDETVAIEKECGCSWLDMNPFRSANQCRAILRTFIAREVSVEEATKRVGSMTVGETTGSMKVADDDLPNEFDGGVPDPKAEAGPETTG